MRALRNSSRPRSAGPRLALVGGLLLALSCAGEQEAGPIGRLTLMDATALAARDAGAPTERYGARIQMGEPPQTVIIRWRATRVEGEQRLIDVTGVLPEPAPGLRLGLGEKPLLGTDAKGVQRALLMARWATTDGCDRRRGQVAFAIDAKGQFMETARTP